MKRMSILASTDLTCFVSSKIQVPKHHRSRLSNEADARAKDHVLCCSIPISDNEDLSSTGVSKGMILAILAQGLCHFHSKLVSTLVRFADGFKPLPARELYSTAERIRDLLQSEYCGHGHHTMSDIEHWY